MALLLTPTSGGVEAWRHARIAATPDLDIRVRPYVGNRADIDVAAMRAAPPAHCATCPICASSFR